MADTNVFINGAATGAFTEALSELPPWATQDTLMVIEGILSKSLDTQNKTFAQLLKSAASTGTALNPDDIKKLNNELDDYLKNLDDLNKQAKLDKDAAAKRAKADKDKDERSKKRMVANALMDKVIGGLIAAGTKVLGVQKQYFNTSEELFKSGVNLISGNNTTQSSMESLNQMVILTGLRLETLQKVVQKYSESVNAVGITKFTKTITLTNQRLSDLGYSSAQQADLIGSMISAESNYSDVRRKSSAEIAKDAVAFGTQITKLSLLTGQSTDKLKDNINALSQNADSMDVAAEYGDDAAKRINEFGAAFKDSKIAETIQQFASTTSIGNEQMFQTLNAAGAGEAAVQLKQTIDKVRDGSLTLEQGMKNLTQVGLSLNKSQIENLKTQQLGGNANAKQARDFFNALRSQGHNLSEATDPQVAAAIKSAASLAKFSTQTESASATLQKAFPLLESEVDKGTAALRLFNDAMNGVIGKLSATTRELIGFGLEITAVIASMAVGAFGLKKVSSSLLDAGTSMTQGILKATGGLGNLATGLGVAAAGAIAAYETFKLIKAFGELSDANKKKEESQKSLDKTNARIAALSPEQRAKFNAIDNDFKKSVKEKSSNLVPAVPTSPMQSTINSPSAVPVTPTSDNADASAGSPTKPEAAVGSGIEKPARNSDINSLLTYQNSISEQMLLSINKLISVNADILKVSRSH